DNFFEIGGHSLKGITIIGKINKHFQVELPLTKLFENKTIKNLARYISQSATSIFTAIQAVEKKEYYPVSAAQKRMVALNRFAPGSVTYNIPGGLIIEGELSVGDFEEAFQKLIQRHESLRSSFHFIESEPVQRIHDNTVFNVTYSELTETQTEEEQAACLLRFLRPFELSRAPLLRVELVKQGDGKHLFLFDTHHIVSDAVSMEILLKEFSALYAGKELPSLTLQYKDYAAWQNRFFESPELLKQKKYWLERYTGEIPVLAMPTDYPRPAVQSFEGETITFEIDNELTEALRLLARNFGSTLYMVLMALFNVLLAKYGGQEDIIVGSPSAGRRHSDVENIIGMFVNTLAMRNSPKPGKAFAAFLTEVKQNSLEVFENQDYQFDELVEHLELRRDLSRNPLFDTLFALLNVGSLEMDLGGINFKPIEVESKVAKFDINMQCIEEKQNMNCNMSYCGKLFSRKTMEQFAARFIKIAKGAADAQGDVLIRDMKLLSVEEEQTMLLEFNSVSGNWREEPSGPASKRTLQNVLKEQAAKTPHYTALEYKNRQLTYKELRLKTRCIAHGLRIHGIERGSVVGVMTGDRMELVTLLSGTLEAGCVFMPVDPNLPLKRIQRMLKLADISILLADTANSNRLRKGRHTIDEKIEIIIPGRDFAKILPARLAAKSSHAARPDDMIYIYFTSGTTGMPKAIAGKNKSLLHFIDWEIETLGIDESIRVSQFTTPGFDVLLRDVFVPLSTGGTVCIPGNREMSDSWQLIQWIDKQNIGLIHCVPSFLRLFDMDALNGDYFKGLKFIVLAGEQVPPGLLKNWYHLFADRIQFVNLYGSTETNLAKIFYFIRPQDCDDGKGRIPAGKPMAGASALILDNTMKICPPLIPGEIVIKTPYRSFGYYNDPRETAAKFVPNPFGVGLGDKPDADDLIYKTGDLGRLLLDNNIEFFGRIDLQVKVRGVRIELEEVENHLCTHPGIKEAAVTVINRGSDPENYLCAYYVPQGNVKAKELKEYLATQVAEYMIPSYFIQLETLPLIAGGKIDRKALPEPGGEIQTKNVYCPPTNAIEIALMEIWKNVLEPGQMPIGIDTDFFEIGGHSLRAINVISKINKKFKVEFPLTEFFKKSTVRQQAHYIENATPITFEQLRVVEKREYYPVSAAQKRLYALNRFAPGSVNYNMPGALLLEGRLSKARFEGAFQKLIRRHESLRTSFHFTEGEPVQRIHNPGKIGFGVTYSELDRSKCESVELTRFLRPFDLSRGPLFRVELEQLKNSTLFLFDMHHIISDGISMGILVKEFGDLYAGRVLKPLAVQYKDYALWQNRFLRSPDMVKQKNYWLEKFAGEIPVLTMPTDYPRPAIQRFEGDVKIFEIDEPLTAKLHRLAGEQGATLYMVLFALFNILLSKYSGQEDIIVGSPAAGRRHTDMANIIGMFVNTLVKRNAPQPGKSFLEFLTEVKQNSLEAFENQDYQFDDLLEHLEIKRDVGRNPLFDTMFTLQNLENDQLEIKGLRIKPHEFGNNVSKFDLSMLISESKGKLFAHLRYCKILFKKETMERLVNHYLNILEEVVAAPGMTLAQINMLSETEEKQLLYEFNDTEAGYPEDKTIHQLFEEQAQRTPDVISTVGSRQYAVGKEKIKDNKEIKEIKDDKESAIREKTSSIRHPASSIQSIQSTQSFPSFLSTLSTQLTYRELTQKSNQLAALLQQKGVNTDTIVAIMVEPSIDMIIGIMGILKAGGAYLPISPGYPEARKQYMLEDTSAGILLSEPGVTGNSDKINKEIETIHINKCIRGQSEASVDLSARRKESGSRSRASGLAYVIYTSGSTGKPKGVAVEQRNVVNVVTWFAQEYELQPGTRVPLMSALTFDASVNQIFGTLLHGASLHIIGRNLLMNLVQLRRYFDRKQLHIINFVPTLIKELLDFDGKLKSLRAVISGAESLNENTKNAILAKGYSLYNQYGPTETTIDALTSRCSKDRVTLGTPISNLRVYILDRSFNTLPVGIAGELFVAGAGVARGYLNKPELTAERFVNYKLQATNYKQITNNKIQITNKENTKDFESEKVTPSQLQGTALQIKAFGSPEPLSPRGCFRKGLWPSARPRSVPEGYA
ncbi:MAG: amino acid adenylation domain-containing protein, partial [bacterium]|nr:amino acid adenylation domain-containing protein [bacterium]